MTSADPCHELVEVTFSLVLIAQVARKIANNHTCILRVENRNENIMAGDQYSTKIKEIK